jgi:hypothetical protein
MVQRGKAIRLWCCKYIIATASPVWITHQSLASPLTHNTKFDEKSEKQLLTYQIYTNLFIYLFIITESRKKHPTCNKMKEEGKGKGFLLQAWCGSCGSRRLRLLDCLDIRHYEGGKVVTLTHRLPSSPGVFLVLIFRSWIDARAHGSIGSFGKNSQPHHWGLIPRPSD